MYSNRKKLSVVVSTHINQNSTVTMCQEGFSFSSKDFRAELLIKIKKKIRKSDLVLRAELLLLPDKI